MLKDRLCPIAAALQRQHDAVAQAARQRALAAAATDHEQLQIGRMLLEQQAAQLKQQQQQQAQMAQARAHAMAGQQKGNSMSNQGQKQPPSTGWQYIDPKNQIQGPFSLLEMQQWYHMNYFRPELKMRRNNSVHNINH
eukprot:Skav203849  [mRNA]  locus=scaffold3841:32594:35387:- [translate_table: standard]